MVDVNISTSGGSSQSLTALLIGIIIGILIAHFCLTPAGGANPKTEAKIKQIRKWLLTINPTNYLFLYCVVP